MTADQLKLVVGVVLLLVILGFLLDMGWRSHQVDRAVKAQKGKPET